jgi:hypothetical protein
LAAACAISIAGITRSTNKGNLNSAEQLKEFSAYRSFASELSQFETSRSLNFLSEDQMAKHIENAQELVSNSTYDNQIDDIQKLETEILAVVDRAKCWFERRVRPGIWSQDFPDLDEFLILVGERLRKLSAPAVALLSIADGWPPNHGDEIRVPITIDNFIKYYNSEKEQEGRVWKVAIIGGGPVGLLTAINLIEIMGKNVNIILYEGRRWLHDKLSMEVPQSKPFCIHAV